MGLSYKARRRWSLIILVIGLPLYIVVAVSLMSWLNLSSKLAEFVGFVGLGVLWAIPLRAVFRGVGQADPDSPSDDIT